MDVMDNVSFNDQAVISVMEIVRMSTHKIKKKLYVCWETTN